MHISYPCVFVFISMYIVFISIYCFHIHILFSYPCILFAHPCILFSYPRVLFSYSHVLFSYPGILFSYTNVCYFSASVTMDAKASNGGGGADMHSGLNHSAEHQPGQTVSCLRKLYETFIDGSSDTISFQS